MSKSLLLKLASIPEGQYSPEEFSRLLRSKHPYPAGSLVPKPEKGVIKWTLENRVNVAVEAIKAGIHIDDVAKTIGWKAFEALTEAVFRAWGYRTKRNQRLGRREVDVLAEGSNMIFVIECKRWRKPAGETTLSQVGTSLIEKLKVLSKNASADTRLIPIVVTLQRYAPRIVNGIPIVPVGTLQNFLQELPELTANLRIISGKSGRNETL